ncbi:Carnitinyl-CoA dehydratase [Falsiruegeria litorea R37]|uniref:Carnitinyl-CoA dehydratase n=1 Tax=Falsiruegeria litorea R37 TaxID=1200284 RepID=A0A1Y5SV83_9RHOB|nr:enoyl-CoA hydratase-related protein [Falsiruegeria litorea]SLN45806.1 Carnitinyl-CoA dehydratase [Falsiruegeria litorea R37]
MNQMTAEPLVTQALDQGVLTVSLGRAPAHPLSREMIAALHGVIVQAGQADDVRVIVIHGSGRIFCAGHDLKEIARHRADADEGREYVEDLFQACSEMMIDITHSPKPTIAMVEGIATAAGLQMVAACDLAYASVDATFCLPGVQNGGFCTTPAVAVSRAIGRKAVMEMALTGAVYDADWALVNGLINRVLAADQLPKHVHDLATTLATRVPGTVSKGKQTLRQHLDLPLREAYDMATPVMVEHFMDPDRRKYDWQA